MKKLFTRIASAPSASNNNNNSDASHLDTSINGSLSPRSPAGNSNKSPMFRSKSANNQNQTKSPASSPSMTKTTGRDAEPAHSPTIDEEDTKAYSMGESLSPTQRRGFAGLCACLLPLVNDGSSDLAWSQGYLHLVLELFLGLPASQVEAFLPMLTANHDALVDYALSSSAHKKITPPPSLELDKLDPAPFCALVVPSQPNDKDDSSAARMKKFKDKAFGKLHLSKPKDNNSSNSNATKQPGSPGPVTSPRASKQAIEAFQLQIVKKLLWFTVKSVGYDARVRTLLRLLVDTMHLSWHEITLEEVQIGRTLYAEATAMPMEKSTAKLSVRDWKRNAAIGAAAVTGGALLALTGGLAAPAIAASLTALGGAGVAIGTVVGSAAGVTATTVLFGTAGAGVVGIKTDTRTRGVQHFNFDLVSAGDGMNVYICISGWLDDEDPKVHGFRRSWGDSRAYLRGFYRTHNPEKVDQVDQVLDRYRGREDEFFAILRKTYRVDGGSDTVDPLGMNASSKDAAMATSNAGDLGSELQRAWRWKDRFAQGDQYCLAWEEDLLRRFGKSMRSFAKEQVVSYANNEIVALTAFAALFAAVAIPRTLLKVADVIDNVWTLTIENADESGKILAETLRRREQGLRPVTLVGYGMGARLIFACLKELAKHDDCFGIVENAVLLGSVVPVVVKEWKNARKMVAGRLINGYSENDWMLAVMYRYQGWALNPAGISAIDVQGVENVNLSSIIKGHMEYKNKIAVILDVLNLEG